MNVDPTYSNVAVFTSRPTNTSVLYCIAYKDTMVDFDFLSYGGERFAKSDMYDTNERVIGKWIDGKPLYQKVISTTASTLNTSTVIAELGSSLDRIAYIDAVMKRLSSGAYSYFHVPYAGNDQSTNIYWVRQN